MIATVQAWLGGATQSDIFAGGLALGAIGVAAAVGRTLVLQGWRILSRRLWARLTFDNRSPAYRHFVLWLEERGVLSHVRHVRMTDPRWSAGTRGYAPAPGRHRFFSGGRLCLLEWSLNDEARVGGSHNPQPMETIEIGAFLGDVEMLAGWVEEGARIAGERDRAGPMLHILRDGYWEEVGEVPARSIDSVVVEDDSARRALEDMRWFYGARDWYAVRGVPWRRGYLLYGPPGTGKSSLIRALASELGLDIAALDVGRATLTDEGLREAMMAAPKRCLLAVEDVDAVFTRREAGSATGGVSFSGLLNAIDGVGAQEGRALALTTNHLERLDPALIRPGRIDVRVEMGHVGAATARALYERFFPGEPAFADAFEHALGSARLSPAAVQGWLLAHRDDARAAAAAGGLVGAAAIAAE